MSPQIKVDDGDPVRNFPHPIRLMIQIINDRIRDKHPLVILSYSADGIAVGVRLNAPESYRWLGWICCERDHLVTFQYYALPRYHYLQYHKLIRLKYSDPRFFSQIDKFIGKLLI